MMVNRERNRGAWPALITPMDDRGHVNHAAQRALVEMAIDEKLGGLYILGSTGQWPLLTLDERKVAAENVVEAATGRIPVIVHVGSASTQDAVELARHAEQIGADGVSSVTPIYYQCSTDNVFRHYAMIGEASSLPLYVYHLSSVDQTNLGPTEYARRVLELPNIAGMKITDHDLYPFGVIAATAGERLELFSGADPLICHATLSGSIGAIGTFYNLWGAIAQKARNATIEGDFEFALRFTSAFQSVINTILASGALWSFMRQAMQYKYDIDIGLPRGPLGLGVEDWSGEEVQQLVQFDRELG